MADVKDGYGASLVVEFVCHPVISDADTPSFPGGQLEASMRPLILS